MWSNARYFSVRMKKSECTSIHKHTHKNTHEHTHTYKKEHILDDTVFSYFLENN